MQSTFGFLWHCKLWGVLLESRFWWVGELWLVLGVEWVEGEGLGAGSGRGAGGSACRGRLEKGSRDCDGGVCWEDACRFLGADFVVAFWAGMDGGSAGAAGAGGDGLNAGDGEGVSGR